MNMLLSNGAWVQYADTYYQRSNGNDTAEVYWAVGAARGDGAWNLKVWRLYKKGPHKRTGLTGRMVWIGRWDDLGEAMREGEKHVP